MRPVHVNAISTGLSRLLRALKRGTGNPLREKGGGDFLCGQRETRETFGDEGLMARDFSLLVRSTNKGNKSRGDRSRETLDRVYLPRI